MEPLNIWIYFTIFLNIYLLLDYFDIWQMKFDPRQRRKGFSSSLCVQTGSGAHPASCPMGTGGPFPGVKAQPGRDADHSPPYSAEN
jgi:hypothetical protein